MTCIREALIRAQAVSVSEAQLTLADTGKGVHRLTDLLVPNTQRWGTLITGLIGTLGPITEVQPLLV